MKKGKNLTLLIGLACVFAVLLWQIIRAVFEVFLVLDANGYKYLMFWEVSPIVITILLLIVPVILLARNVKNKTGKVLPIISIILNGVNLLLVLFNSFTPAIPKYLIISKLGLIDTYATIILWFFKDGGLLFLVGYILLIIGSALSLPRKPQKAECDTQEGC